MNKKYYFDILVSAQVNRYIFLVVYEPYRVLEGLQGVGFQGKNCFTKLVSNFSEIDFGFTIYITWKNEQKILIRQFGICPGQCTSDRRSGVLKKIFKKWWRFSTSTMQKIVSEGCALCKKYQYDISVFWQFPSFLFFGLILVQTAVLANLVFAYSGR